MPNETNSILTTALEYIWAVVLIPLKMLWTKADNAVSRAELKDIIQNMDAKTNELRATTVKLFENAEHDRRNCRADFNRVQDEIHKTHIEILNEIRKN